MDVGPCQRGGGSKMYCRRDVSRNRCTGGGAESIVIDASGGSIVPVEFDEAGNGWQRGL